MYYLGEGEETPTHKVQHKSHIKKVMFLAAVARPRRNTGRFLCIPQVLLTMAPRNSVRSSAGCRDNSAGTFGWRIHTYKTTLYRDRHHCCTYCVGGRKGEKGDTIAGEDSSQSLTPCAKHTGGYMAFGSTVGADSYNISPPPLEVDPFRANCSPVLGTNLSNSK